MKRIIIFSAAIILIYALITIVINLPGKKTEIAKTTFNAAQPTGTTAPSADLRIEDITPGTGEKANTGQSITVNYIGTLTNGDKFDSSYDRKSPFTFTLGAGEVIKGWDQGLIGLRIGGKRKLTIPAELGYGSKSQGTIPPNSTLIFEVELLDIAGKEKTQPDLNL